MHFQQANITRENVLEVSQVLEQATDRVDGIFTDEDILNAGDAVEMIVHVGDGSLEVRYLICYIHYFFLNNFGTTRKAFLNINWFKSQTVALYLMI